MTIPRHSDSSGGKPASGGRAYELVDVAMREAADKPRAIVRLRQLAGEWFQRGNIDDAHALVANLIRWGKNNDVPAEAISALKNDLSAIEAHKSGADFADDDSAGQPKAKPEKCRKQEKNDSGQKAPARFNVGSLYLPAISAVIGFVLALVLSGVDVDSPARDSSADSEVSVQADGHPPTDNAAADNPPAINNPQVREKPVISPKLPEKKKEMYVSALGGVNIRTVATGEGGIVGKIGRFVDVIAIGKLQNGWQKVQVGDMAGYIRGDLLADGKGEIARCESGVRRPANGEIFVQQRRGRHSIKVNAANSDIFAKLKDANRRTVLSFYIHANQRVAINNVADGSYFFQFATGGKFSVVCGKFMRDAQYGADPGRNDFDEPNKVFTLEYQLERTFRGNLRIRDISEEEFLR